MDSDKYWAACEDPAEFGRELKQVLEENAKASVVQTVLDEQRNAYLQLFAINLQGTASSSRIMRDGQEGELATFRVPLASALANAVVNLITNQKITWQCQAANGDAKSRAQTATGNRALEHYWHDKGGEAFAKTLAVEGVPFGECIGFVEYDQQAGEIKQVAPGPDGQTMVPQYEGDARFNVVSSWDCARDPKAKSWEDSDWYAVRLRRNRFSLAAQLGAAVLEACSDKSKGMLADTTESSTRSELVDCWYWFHKKTPAIPLGRQAIIIGDKVFALDRLKYRRVPLVRFYTGNLTGTPLPFAPFWTALGAQELHDSLLSAIATNNLTLGTQMVAAPMGTEIEPDSVGPMRMLFYPPGVGEPKGLNLTQSSPESFKLLELVENKQRLLMGLNGAALGQPEGANLSGVAMTMLASMAIQANSSAQAVYAQVVKEIGAILLEIWQDFFTIERKIRIAGKSAGRLEELALSDKAVAGVSNVSVRIGNPLSQTVAGREALFDKYMRIQTESQGAIQLIKTPEDVQQLLENGTLDGMTDPLRDQAILVEAENEALSRNEPVRALLGDDNVYHCRHHRSVVTSLDARQDEALLNNALDHVHEHYFNEFGVPAVDEMSGMTDPLYRERMMYLFGIIPAPPQPMAPPGMGMPPDDGAAEPPPEAALSGELPENPLTGQEFDPVTGGGVVAPAGVA